MGVEDVVEAFALYHFVPYCLNNTESNECIQAQARTMHVAPFYLASSVWFADKVVAVCSEKGVSAFVYPEHCKNAGVFFTPSRAQLDYNISIQLFNGPRPEARLVFKPNAIDLSHEISTASIIIRDDEAVPIVGPVHQGLGRSGLSKDAVFDVLENGLQDTLLNLKPPGLVGNFCAFGSSTIDAQKPR